MKVIVFGATGKVGQQVLRQGLEQGHQVSAFVRRPHSLESSHNGVNVVKGDVLNTTQVCSAVEGHEIVICALGMPLMNKDGLRGKGTQNIIAAMQETGVKRLICVSALGAGDSRQWLPAVYRYFLIPLFMRSLYADHEVQEFHIKNSQLDWSIIRPGSFIKGGRSGDYWHGLSANVKKLSFKISHADVADFVLKQLGDNAYLHKMVGVSYLK